MMETRSLNIICIDDDEFMLKAIGRTIRRLYPEWNIWLSTNPVTWRGDWGCTGYEAPAIFISDLLMPGKRGDQLLEEIKDTFPDAIRVLLTGDSSLSLEEDAHSYAHFVLPKPFTDDDFKHLFRCAERLRQMPFDDACRHRLGGLSDLPVLPDTVLRLQKVINSPSCDIHKIAAVVSHEPPLVARIFQLANSPYFGFRRMTDSLSEAVGRLGATAVESLAVTQLTRIQHNRLTPRVHQDIAEKALEIGSIGRMLSKQLGMSLVEQDKVFVASLLTSIGALVLVEQGVSVEKLADGLGLQEGYSDHHIVAAYVLIMWGYEIEIGDIILNQRVLRFDSDKPEQLCASIVGLSTNIANRRHQEELDELAQLLPEKIANALVTLIPLLLKI